MCQIYLYINSQQLEASMKTGSVISVKCIDLNACGYAMYLRAITQPPAIASTSDFQSMMTFKYK